MKLDVKATALAAGLLWALGVLLLGWMSALGLNSAFVGALGNYYIGYAPTFLGGIIGAIWGFVDAAVFGLVFAWLYNSITKK